MIILGREMHKGNLGDHTCKRELDRDQQDRMSKTYNTGIAESLRVGYPNRRVK